MPVLRTRAQSALDELRKILSDFRVLESADEPAPSTGCNIMPEKTPPLKSFSQPGSLLGPPLTDVQVLAWSANAIWLTVPWHVATVIAIIAGETGTS